MAHLEDDQVLHPQVLLNEVHSLRPLHVLEGIVVLSIQFIHDIPLEVLEEIHLVLQFLRVLGYSVWLAEVNSPIPASRDVVEVATEAQKIISIVTGGERRDSGGMKGKYERRLTAYSVPTQSTYYR